MLHGPALSYPQLHQCFCDYSWLDSELCSMHELSGAYLVAMLPLEILGLCASRPALSCCSASRPALSCCSCLRRVLSLRPPAHPAATGSCIVACSSAAAAAFSSLLRHQHRTSLQLQGVMLTLCIIVSLLCWRMCIPHDICSCSSAGTASAGVCCATSCVVL